MKVCRKRLNKVHTLQEADSESEPSPVDDDYLHILTTDSDNHVNLIQDKWLTDLIINEKKLSFRIDTGAKCNIMVKSEFDNLHNDVKSKLQKSDRTLKSFTYHKIKPIGSLTLPVSHEQKPCNVKFEIVDLDQENITLKKSYKRPPHIFSSSSESKLRSIKIHDQINKPMSNSGSESVCIPNCVLCLTHSKHE